MTTANAIARTTALLAAVLLAAALLAPGTASGRAPDDPYQHDFVTPVLGMNATPKSDALIVADTGRGVVRVGPNGSRLVTQLPGVVDVVQVSRNRILAITGDAPSPVEPGAAGGQPQPSRLPSQTLFRISDNGKTLRPLADLDAFERKNNPDGGYVESNPHGIAANGPTVLVADASANTLLRVRPKGRIEVVATFPSQEAPTDWLKRLTGCHLPGVPENYAELCELPETMPAEPVPTTVAVGPDGAYYVGELVGLPGPAGNSRIWRIEPGTRGAACGTDESCRIVASGLTSIIDMNFGKDGQLYVAELDRRTWIADEIGSGVGGAISKCDVDTGTCADMAQGVQMPTSLAVDRRCRVFTTAYGITPELMHIVPLNSVRGARCQAR